MYNYKKSYTSTIKKQVEFREHDNVMHEESNPTKNIGDAMQEEPNPPENVVDVGIDIIREYIY